MEYFCNCLTYEELQELANASAASPRPLIKGLSELFAKHMPGSSSRRDVGREVPGVKELGALLKPPPASSPSQMPSHKSKSGTCTWH